jgi:putative serine protease PepD
VWSPSILLQPRPRAWLAYLFVVMAPLAGCAAGDQGHSIGSGDVIRADGYIVTNDHAVRGFTRFQVVLSSGQTLPASLVGEAPIDDLSVLKVAASGLQPVLFGDSASVPVEGPNMTSSR